MSMSYFEDNVVRLHVDVQCPAGLAKNRIQYTL